MNALSAILFMGVAFAGFTYMDYFNGGKAAEKAPPKAEHLIEPTDRLPKHGGAGPPPDTHPDAGSGKQAISADTVQHQEYDHKGISDPLKLAKMELDMQSPNDAFDPNKAPPGYPSGSKYHP